MNEMFYGMFMVLGFLLTGYIIYYLLNRGEKGK